jgi:hypothetical protein
MFFRNQWSYFVDQTLHLLKKLPQMLAIKHKESVRLGQKFQLVIAIKSAKGALFQSKILEIVPI